MKGYNVVQIGNIIHDAWVTYRDPAWFGLDAVRFDQHVSEACLSWEHSIYKLFYSGNAELARLLAMQLHNRGFISCADGRVEFRTKGTRCSGDMNTALGNCLLMCAMNYELILDADLHRNVRLFNNGDDCVFVGEHGDISRLHARAIAHFRVFGFLLEVEPVSRIFEKLSFCQMQPVYDGVNWRMVRDPFVSLSKDATVLSLAYATTRLRELIASIGECGLSLTGGMPILQEFYGAFTRGSRGAKALPDENFMASGFYRNSIGLHAKYYPVSDVARASFYAAFGISPTTQVALEAQFASLDLSGDLTIGLGRVPFVRLT